MKYISNDTNTNVNVNSDTNMNTDTDRIQILQRKGLDCIFGTNTNTDKNVNTNMNYNSKEGKWKRNRLQSKRLGDRILDGIQMQIST